MEDRILVEYMDKLEAKLRGYGKAAIAFSGGIDSSFLLFVANRVLPREDVLALICDGVMVSGRDHDDAMRFVKENGFKFEELNAAPLEIPEFRENRIDRCYHCKKMLLSMMKKKAGERGFDVLMDGENLDDQSAYRPGARAAQELGIERPLADLGIGKTMIREMSRELGIAHWDKPSNSCLATRFPYDTELTPEGLKSVEKSEDLIRELGVSNVRVRKHGDTARIEVPEKDFRIMIESREAVARISEYGFRHVSLDLTSLDRK
ncbi:MAG: ATP-dependent sacrificial sulfur transferase LarE [Eubacterium sp.]|nr:ATP-dependent sacrificial sulfur transferase LarE [Eubacterium sp.]